MLRKCSILSPAVRVRRSNDLKKINPIYRKYGYSDNIPDDFDYTTKYINRELQCIKSSIYEVDDILEDIGVLVKGILYEIESANTQNISAERHRNSNEMEIRKLLDESVRELSDSYYQLQKISNNLFDIYIRYSLGKSSLGLTILE